MARMLGAEMFFRTLIDQFVDCEELVYPMIAPGGTMNEMLLQPVDVA